VFLPRGDLVCRSPSDWGLARCRFISSPVLSGRFGLKCRAIRKRDASAEFGPLVSMLFLIGSNWSRLAGAPPLSRRNQRLRRASELESGARSPGLESRTRRLRIGRSPAALRGALATAIVMQSLRETVLAQTDPGRAIFSVLRWVQDIAGIPMLALFHCLARWPGNGRHSAGPLANLPAWAQPFFVFGRRRADHRDGAACWPRPLFRRFAARRVREIFHCDRACGRVVGALLMQTSACRLRLARFVAFVVLRRQATFRHEIEATS